MLVAGMVIVVAAAVGILAVGILYLTRPRMMAASFGLPVLPDESATPWLRLKGVRDLASGVIAGTLLLTAPTHVVGYAVVAFTIIPVGDAVMVLQAGGSRAAAFGIHGLTAAAMLVGAVLLLAA